MKTLVMRQWMPEAIQTPEENDLLVAGVFKTLEREDHGATSVFVGGDTLVFGAVDSEGEIHIYECSIRRATESTVVENLPEDCVGTRQAGSDPRPS